MQHFTLGWERAGQAGKASGNPIPVRKLKEGQEGGNSLQGQDAKAAGAGVEAFLGPSLHSKGGMSGHGKRHRDAWGHLLGLLVVAARAKSLSFPRVRLQEEPQAPSSKVGFHSQALCHDPSLSPLCLLLSP